ncbi:MAG: malate/lactate/ureidoglycolate dehydrogenase [Alphaproteobacteria bacterium]|nr:malate/lactate/ureidoglycolate dehydrogenase [Alphaproteobacteria bacterium]
MIIRHEPLVRLVADIFAAAGCQAAEAGRIATMLAGANLAGHDSHGIIRVPRYVEALQGDRVKAAQTLTTIVDGGAFALVDGNYGFGQTVGPLAVALGIERARRHGVAVIGLRHAGHLGRIGDYPETAAAAGQVSIHLVNVAGSELVAPFGGVDRRFSTAPVAIGLPVPGEEPIILDFATSLVAEGKALVAHSGGKALPAGALIEPDGTLSSDPRTLYGEVPPGAVPDPRKGAGALRTFGEHKGSGLALMCELLAGAFTGSGCSGPGPRPLANGMLSIYMAVDHFHSDDGFARELRQYVDYVKGSRPATSGGEVLVPGEPERRTRAKRLAEGIPLSDQAWKDILATARRVGLSEDRLRAVAN